MEHQQTQPILTIMDLQVAFHLDEGVLRAVDGVSLVIPRGRTLALVGESGCGKSVTAQAVLRLISPPGRITGGAITLHRDGGDVELTALDDDGDTIRAIRGREIAIIFQEPMTALSPVHCVGDQIVEAIRLHAKISGREARARAIRLLERVRIPDAARRFRQYPHEMSGGLRQRALIAMALCCRAPLLIADEPTTALDVTIQAQVLALLRELQDEFGMALLLITHDLGVVAEMAHAVAVMYLGRIVEQAPVEQLFAAPSHPYTRALLHSLPGVGERKTVLQVIAGAIPEPFQCIAGCPFHPRCAEAVPGLCDVGAPPPLCDTTPAHRVACLLRQKEHARG